MQVFCKPTNAAGDLRCNICNQRFHLHFTPVGSQPWSTARYEIQMTLRDQHLGTDAPDAHPREGFRLAHEAEDAPASAAA